jgi:hypothetical protein
MDYITFQKSQKLIPYGLEDRPEYEIFDWYVEKFNSEGGLSDAILENCSLPPIPPQERVPVEEENEEEDVEDGDYYSSPKPKADRPRQKLRRDMIVSAGAVLGNEIACRHANTLRFEPFGPFPEESSVEHGEYGVRIFASYSLPGTHVSRLLAKPTQSSKKDSYGRARIFVARGKETGRKQTTPLSSFDRRGVGLDRLSTGPSSQYRDRDLFQVSYHQPMRTRADLDGSE